MLKRNLVANFLGQGLVAVFGFVFIPTYVRYLGVESYGLIGLFAVLSALFSLLDMGLTSALGREMARAQSGANSAETVADLLRSVEVISTGLILVVFGLAGVSAEWIASHWVNTVSLPVSVVTEAFIAMAVVTALRFLEGVYRSCIIGLDRQLMFNVINVAATLLRNGGAAVVLIFLSPTIQAFFLWQGVASLVTLLCLAIATYRILPSSSRTARFSAAALKEVWKFAGGVFLITILALSLTQLDKLLLSKLLPLTEFGQYTLASVVAGALFMLILPISQAWAPRLTGFHASGDESGFERLYHLGSQLISVLLGGAAIVLAFYSEVFLRVWTGDAVLAARVAPILTLLALGNLLNGLMWIPYQAQLAYGWTGLTVHVNVVAVAVLVPALLYVVPRWGAIGAAWVWLTLNACYVLISAQFMYLRILPRAKWQWYLWDLAFPLATTTLAIACLHAFSQAPTGIVDSLLTLLLAACVALLAGGVSSDLLRKQMATFVRRVSL